MLSSESAVQMKFICPTDDEESEVDLEITYSLLFQNTGYDVYLCEKSVAMISGVIDYFTCIYLTYCSFDIKIFTYTSNLEHLL